MNQKLLIKLVIKLINEISKQKNSNLEKDSDLEIYIDNSDYNKNEKSLDKPLTTVQLYQSNKKLEKISSKLPEIKFFK